MSRGFEGENRNRKRFAILMHGDAVQFTRHMRENLDRTYDKLHAAFKIFTKVINAWNGNVVNIAGDSILAEFASLGAAINASREIQEKLDFLPDEDGECLTFRIGIAIGDVIENTHGLFGDGVNIAARLQQLASPCGIYISEAAFNALDQETARNFTFVGEFVVKNIEAPLRVYNDSTLDTCRGVGVERLKVAEKIEVTVLACKLLHRPQCSSDNEDVYNFISVATALFTEKVRSFGGVVVNTLGPLLLATFGYPSAHRNDPACAVHAAWAIQRTLGAGLTTEELDSTLRLGIDSGSVIIETVSNGDRKEISGFPVTRSSDFTDLVDDCSVYVSDEIALAISEAFHVERAAYSLRKGGGRFWRVTSAMSARKVEQIVGRSFEVEQFQQIVTNTHKRAIGQIIWIEGAAGIGKTTLKDKFVSIAQEVGLFCYSGHVLDFGDSRDFGAIKEIARSIIGIDVAMIRTELLKKLDTFLSDHNFEPLEWPLVYDFLDLPLSDEYALIVDAMDVDLCEDKRRQIIVKIVKEANPGSPILIAIEDLHWADPTTLRAITDIVGVILERSAILVLTARTDPQLERNDWLDVSRGASTISMSLGPLGADDAYVMAQNLGFSDEALIKKCIDRASGNGFYLRQLLYCGASEGSETLPLTVLATIRARVDQLQASERAALQAASVVGTRFSRPIVEFILQSSNFDLQILVDFKLLSQHGREYAFDHALISDATYGSLLKATKRHLHGRAALWYKARNPTLWAVHLERAGDATAAEAYVVAAREEYVRSHTSEALSLIERGQAIANSRIHRFSLGLLKAELLLHLAKADQSISELRMTLDLADNEVDRCAVWILQAANLIQSDDYKGAVAILEKVEAAAKSLGSQDLLARMHHLYGNLCFPLGQIDRCHDHQKQALRYATAAGSLEMQVRALSGLGDAEYASGAMSRALHKFEQCIELAKTHNFNRLVVGNQHMIPTARHYLANLELALEDAHAALEAAIDCGYARAELCSLSCLSVIAFDAGRTADLLTFVRRGVKLAENLNSPRFIPLNFVLASKAYRQAGDLPAARDSIMQAMEICRQVGMAYNGLRVLSEFALSSNDNAERDAALAEGEALLARGVLGSDQLWFLRDAIDVSLLHGQWDRASGYAEQLEAFAADDPLPWSTFHAERGRTLAGIGADPPTDEFRFRLKSLEQTAVELGYGSALPTLRTALAGRLS